MENRVSRIASTLQKIYQNKCQNQTFQCPVKSFNICEGTDQRSCLNTFPTVSTCNGESRYSLTSGIRIPNSYSTLNLSQEIKYFICKTADEELQNVLHNLIQQNDKRYAWTAFGSNSGGHRVSPGFKYQKQQNTQSCKNYDPRLRPWYTLNAYRRKKLIILMQNSKSIHDQPNRYPSIQLSLQAILKTSDLEDMFNVIEFSDAPRALLSQKDLKLVELNQQINKYNSYTQSQDDFYTSLANNITKSQSYEVDYMQAIQMAIQILKNSQNENPELENIILMFNGFKPTNYSLGMQQDINNFLSSKKQQLNINFSFFGFGVNLLDSEGINLLQSLACNFEGVYIPISDITYESMFLDQAAPYYEFLSQGNEVRMQKWTGFYQDAFGLGKMVSVVKPAYYVENNVTRLIGLAGVDVLLEQLIIYKNEEDISKQLQTTEPPFIKNISLCALQTIRRDHKCFNPSKINCSNTNFCKVKLNPYGSTVIRTAVDSSNLSCCFLDETSHTGLIVGLVIGISGAILIIILLVYLLIFRKRGKTDLEKTYRQIFESFKDFDQTRVRSESQISLIKD